MPSWRSGCWRMAARGAGPRCVRPSTPSARGTGKHNLAAPAVALRPGTAARRRRPPAQGRAARGRARGGVGPRLARRPRGDRQQRAAPRQRRRLPRQQRAGCRAAAASRRVGSTGEGSARCPDESRSRARGRRIDPEGAVRRRKRPSRRRDRTPSRHGTRAGSRRGKRRGRSGPHPCTPPGRRSEHQAERLTRRLAEVETRLGASTSSSRSARSSAFRSAAELGAERAGLADLESQQEAAREQRVRWQVEADRSRRGWPRRRSAPGAPTPRRRPPVSRRGLAPRRSPASSARRRRSRRNARNGKTRCRSAASRWSSSRPPPPTPRRMSHDRR